MKALDTVQWPTPWLKDNFPHQEGCVVGSAWLLQKKPITRHLPEMSRHRYLPDIIGARYNRISTSCEEFWNFCF